MLENQKIIWLDLIYKILTTIVFMGFEVRARVLRIKSNNLIIDPALYVGML